MCIPVPKQVTKRVAVDIPLEPTKPKRVRRVIPEEKDYIFGEPTENDVLAGRGAKSNNHQGNKAYWRKILAKRDLYKQSTTNEDKASVAQKIVDLIKSETGRFLQKDKETELWFKLPHEVAMSKVKQALRDKHVPKWFKDGENEEEGDVDIEDVEDETGGENEEEGDVDKKDVEDETDGENEEQGDVGIEDVEDDFNYFDDDNFNEFLHEFDFK